MKYFCVSLNIVAIFLLNNNLVIQRNLFGSVSLQGKKITLRGKIQTPFIHWAQFK